MTEKLRVPDSTAAIACAGLWKVFGHGASAQLHSKLANGTANNAASIAADLRAANGIVACADIELNIKPGEFFVLMGLSGSGKSTLLRCLSRLTEPSAGQLALDGKDFLNISRRALRDIRRKKMGMVFQHFGLFPHMTVRDNVTFALRVQGIAEEVMERTAAQMIELVGLQGREMAYPHELSGGQKQRVGIARSLAVDPQLWFLDEPFSALDPLIRGQMQTELLRLQTRFKKTIVFVTHDFMEAVRLADRIAIMKDGAIVQVGTPAQIVLSPSNNYVGEFVREVPRTRIIKLSQLMQPLPLTDGATPPAGDSASEPTAESTYHSDMTLEQALAQRAFGGNDLTVCDATGQVQGVVTAKAIANALLGPETAQPSTFSAG